MTLTPKARAEQFVRSSLGKLGLTGEAKRRIVGDLMAQFNEVAVSKDRAWTEMLKGRGAAPDLLDAGYGRD